MIRKLTYIIFTLALALTAVAQGQNMGNVNEKGQRIQKKKQEIQQISYAWRPIQPLGLIERCGMDTLEYNYYQQSIPSEAFSYAWACTGNMGAEGKNMLFWDQRSISKFFLEDAQLQWVPTLEKLKFYNTRIPMTLISFNTGGGRDNTQDRLTALFSGNINKKAQVGAHADYIYSKGSYANQAAKGFSWGLEGSYIGDRYEMQAAFSHYYMLNKENGGITNDLYILDPAQLQGGETKIDAKSIPTKLSAAHTRVDGTNLYVNNRYKVGYWIEERDSVNVDSIVNRTYVPVTSFIWTLIYRDGKHNFNNQSKAEADKFFEHTYLNGDITDDKTQYWSLSNTVGVSLLEGFKKWAKFGLAAYATYEIRKFTQTVDTIPRDNPEERGLTPFPEGGENIRNKKMENLLWVGAQLTKQQGSILRYSATAELGVLAEAAGEIKVSGDISTRIPLFGDTVEINAYGKFSNTTAPYLMNQYLSNHFIWNNNFGKERRLRFGGELYIPWTRTRVNIGTETLQNYIYFNDLALPQQHDGGIQVFNVRLDQNFKVGILHWNNSITYQTSTNEDVLSLPKLAIYSNLFILCKIATLHLQLGVDCDFYTKYYAPAYQPAIAQFHTQKETKLGGYPFMNAYANMKLGRVRFYVMFSHFNQGLFGGNNYFSSPHYPLNPRRFQMGLSVDFHD